MSPKKNVAAFGFAVSMGEIAFRKVSRETVMRFRVARVTLGDIPSVSEKMCLHDRCGKNVAMSMGESALHSTLDILHSTLYPLRSTLLSSTFLTPHFLFHTSHATQYTPHTLHSTHFTPQALYKKNFTLYTVHSTLYTA